MVLTILEAEVAADNEALLEAAFNEAIGQLDAGIAETFLLRNAKDPRLWRIATLWQDREALDAMRASVETPRGVLMFRAAAAEPALSIYDVVSRGQASPASQAMPDEGPGPV